jgi:hypothetical protein
VLSRRSSLIAALLIGLLAGIGYALVEIAVDCWAPSSEACFWGKHYFPLTLGLSILILGGAVAGLAYAGLMWHRRRQSNDDAV